MKKQGVAQLKKKADAAFSKYVRYRDGEFKRGEWWTTCITCGVEKPLKQMQAGHFVSRAVNKLRYDELNVHGQCYACNVMRYGEQYLYAKEIDERYGNGTAEALMAQKHQTHKFTIPELEEIIHDALEQVKFYESQA